MIVGLIGERGSGKTLTMAKIVKEMLKKGRTVYTNFHINKKAIDEKYHNNIKLLDNQFFKDFKTFKLYKCCLFLDEVYIYLDSRMSSTKRNRIWSYFINQTRKRDVDLYYTTQFFRQVEIRLRMNTEVFIFPTKVTIEGKIVIINKICKFTDRLKQIATERFLGEKYFDIYDTDEIIDFDDDVTKEKK